MNLRERKPHGNAKEALRGGLAGLMLRLVVMNVQKHDTNGLSRGIFTRSLDTG